MTPYYEDDLVTLYHGDCMELLPTIRAGAVITDPPYGVSFKGQAWDGYIPIEWLQLARDAAPVVAFTTGPLTLWDYPAPDWVMAWHRPAAQSRTTTGAFNHWTPILVYGKGAWNPDVKSIHAMTVGNQNAGLDHPSPKPVALFRWLITGATDGTVIDPFAGSGTTLRAAKDMGQKAIGIEINERYCEVAANRLRQGSLAEMFQ